MASLGNLFRSAGNAFKNLPGAVLGTGGPSIPTLPTLPDTAQEDRATALRHAAYYEQRRKGYAAGGRRGTMLAGYNAAPATTERKTLLGS